MNYTSKNFENKADASASTAEHILFFIKSRGPASTATLAKALDMTGEAARQQVQKLLAAGLLEGSAGASAGVGRPRQDWALTAAGHSRFPDTHAQLTVQLIGAMRTLFGDDGMERLIAQREAASRAVYVEACTGQPVPQRLRRLAAVRSEEGYMARVEQDGGDWLLIEDHCPICAAASVCQGFCRSEMRLFQEAIGDAATLQREEHLLAGARRCVYRITPVSS